MSELASRTCVPCRGGVPPMDSAEVESYLGQVEGWGHAEHRRIARTFVFPDFAGALDFANRVGEIAEAEGHHPDLLVAWGRGGGHHLDPQGERSHRERLHPGRQDRSSLRRRRALTAAAGPKNRTRGFGTSGTGFPGAGLI